MILIGCAFLGWGKTKIELYVARYFVGIGSSLLTISSPVLISQVWPDIVDILATTGISFQSGHLPSEAFDMVLGILGMLHLSPKIVIQIVGPSISPSFSFIVSW